MTENLPDFQLSDDDPMTEQIQQATSKSSRAGSGSGGGDLGPAPQDRAQAAAAAVAPQGGLPEQAQTGGGKAPVAPDEPPEAQFEPDASQ